MHPKIGGNY